MLHPAYTRAHAHKHTHTSTHTIQQSVPLSYSIQACCVAFDFIPLVHPPATSRTSTTSTLISLLFPPHPLLLHPSHLQSHLPPLHLTMRVLAFFALLAAPALAFVPRMPAPVRARASLTLRFSGEYSEKVSHLSFLHVLSCALLPHASSPIFCGQFLVCHLGVGG